MNRKILYSFIVLMSLLFVCANSVSAITPAAQKNINSDVEFKVDGDGTPDDDYDIIKRVSFRDKFRKSPEKQINDFFKKFTKYSAQNNLEKLKELYSDDYLNNDGFNKTTIFKMMEMSTESYENFSYNTEIESIQVDGNYAVVKGRETAQGQTSKKIDKVNDFGIVDSDVKYTDYLKKIDNKWKITASVIDEESVSLKYGEAKTMEIEMNAPKCVPAGGEYEVSVKTTSPDGVFIVGSIVNEPIVYPQTQNQDVFRSVKSEELARVLKANTDNNNEYATFSVAITRAQIEPPSVILNMTGMAFVMKRVNVLPVNKNIKFEEVSPEKNVQKDI